MAAVGLQVTGRVPESSPPVTPRIPNLTGEHTPTQGREDQPQAGASCQPLIVQNTHVARSVRDSNRSRGPTSFSALRLSTVEPLSRRQRAPMTEFETVANARTTVACCVKRGLAGCSGRFPQLAHPCGGTFGPYRLPSSSQTNNWIPKIIGQL